MLLHLSGRVLVCSIKKPALSAALAKKRDNLAWIGAKYRTKNVEILKTWKSWQELSRNEKSDRISKKSRYISKWLVVRVEKTKDKKVSVREILKILS